MKNTIYYILISALLCFMISFITGAVLHDIALLIVALVSYVIVSIGMIFSWYKDPTWFDPS